MTPWLLKLVLLGVSRLYSRCLARKKTDFAAMGASKSLVQIGYAALHRRPVVLGHAAIWWSAFCQR